MFDEITLPVAIPMVGDVNENDFDKIFVIPAIVKQEIVGTKLVADKELPFLSNSETTVCYFSAKIPPNQM